MAQQPVAPKKEPIKLAVNGLDADLIKALDFNTVFTTRKQVDNELRSIKSTLLNEGYLAVSIDSVHATKVLVTATFHQGKLYKWAQLKRGNAEEDVLSSIGFRDKLYRNKPLRPGEYQNLFEKLIKHYENNGYPFVSLNLDSIEFEDESISAVLNVQKNQLVKIDSIHIKGETSASDLYIYNYLSMKPGIPYNESLIRQIGSRLKEIPFVQQIKPAEIEFTEKSTELYLYIKDKKASQFNGILGVLPDNETGKITITGDARLRLKNALKRGELIDFNWRKLQTLTQDLKVSFNYPFLFNTPFGIDLNFKLYKQDSTFIELNRNIGVQFLLKGGNYLKVYLNNQTSDLLDASNFVNSTTLPPFADISTNIYGIGIKKEKLDYRLNPRKGFSVYFNGGAGIKTIKKINDLDESIYDDIKLRSTQYNLDAQAAVYLPLKNRSTVKVGVNAAYIYNENMFINEMHRIGGIKTLRGFDEISIIASAYSIFTLEYRFLLEQNSNLYVFFDGAYYENRSTGSFISDTPYGFGAGISFQTKPGIFSINYALGKQFDNPILFRAAKIHFGFINYF
jgi:outer membrane protein assembly factor BamA